MDKSAAALLRRRIRLVVAAAWTLVILALCTIPGSELPDVRIVSGDKIGHFTMFAAFGWLWMHALRINVPARRAWVFGAGFAYAVLTEVYQGILPYGREPDVWDAVANTAGLIVGIGIWRLTSRRDSPVTAAESRRRAE